MRVYIGADHRGFPAKEQVKLLLAELGVEVLDLGADRVIPDDDYVDYAHAVATKVATDSTSRGIVLCGSGVGVDMVANKVNGIRSGLGIAEDQVMAARKDDDINVLALATDYTLPEELKKMVKSFLSTPFSSNERYSKRLDKVAALEKQRTNV